MKDLSICSQLISHRQTDRQRLLDFIVRDNDKELSCDLLEVLNCSYTAGLISGMYSTISAICSTESHFSHYFFFFHIESLVLVLRFKGCGLKWQDES